MSPAARLRATWQGNMAGKHGRDRGEVQNTHPEEGFPAEFQAEAEERLIKEKVHERAEKSACRGGQKRIVKGFFRLSLQYHGSRPEW